MNTLAEIIKTLRANDIGLSPAGCTHIAAQLEALIPKDSNGPPGPDFPQADGVVTFWADGENAPCEELELSVEHAPEKSTEDLEFTLREGGDLHDGHATLADVADAFPEVCTSFADWHAGRTRPFAELLIVARETAKREATKL